ncbi:MAG TPA: RNA polymerase sigma-70 factor [Prolixibacteraceae bacterium]|nr:RNA polymerase sigma-70 factor [Prolixibacteraceae bacterium]
MISQNLPSNILKGLSIGDEETYIFLFREYYVSLCAYSRRYVGRKDIAEEIVSDTFLKIWENRKRLEINASIKAYLFHAVCNNSLNFLRKLKAENNLGEYFKETSSENLGFEVTSEEIEEQSLIMENMNQKIEEAVNLLPEQQQKAFRLKRMEGRKTKEVAEIMGLSVKTIEMHLSKATLHLRQNLKDYLPSFLLFLLFK